MIIVIQCAARKHEEAGFLRAANNKRVLFVADPKSAPTREDCIYAAPDDMSDAGGTWRDMLVAYNAHPGDNPFNLHRAFELYGNNAYRDLVAKFGVEQTYILSAGWGLIPASFLIPYYDITFSSSADAWKRRKKTDLFNDLCLLPTDTTEDILFLGGKDYLPLFVKLTSGIRAPRTAFYNSATPPNTPGCNLVRFHTTTRTNWHYECAHALLHGQLVS